MIKKDFCKKKYIGEGFSTKAYVDVGMKIVDYTIIKMAKNDI